MTKVAPSIKCTAVFVGTVGLAAVGTAAGAVPARAADTNGTSSSSTPTIALRDLLSPDSNVTRLGLDKLPVVGALPNLLSDLPVTAMPPIVPAALKSPGARTRNVHGTQEASAPARRAEEAATAAPVQAPVESPVTAAPVAEPSLGSLGSSTPEDSPLMATARSQAPSRGLGLLPLMSNVPLVDSAKASELLVMLAGGGLSGLGPVGGLTHGLGGVAAL